MIKYVGQYPYETFRVIGWPEDPLVERTFTLRTGLYLDCQCGPQAKIVTPDNTTPMCTKCGEHLEEIEYGGIFDGLVEWDSSVYVLEHKSTSQLGSYYFDQFKPNNQITGYIWGGGTLSGMRVGGAIVNAIGVYKASPTKFERQITNRSKED